MDVILELKLINLSGSNPPLPSPPPPPPHPPPTLLFLTVSVLLVCVCVCFPLSHAQRERERETEREREICWHGEVEWCKGENRSISSIATFDELPPLHIDYTDAWDSLLVILPIYINLAHFSLRVYVGVCVCMFYSTCARIPQVLVKLKRKFMQVFLCEACQYKKYTT